jgi:hypothetical protein
VENVVESVRPQTAIQYSACALHAGYLKLQTRTQNMEYLLLFHDNNGYENAPKFYFVLFCLSCFKKYARV